MANPIETLTKPITFGARQAINATQTALRAGGSLVEAIRGGEEPPPQPQQQPRRRSSRQPKQLDDVSITRKVETVIFRDAAVPKGKIDVNTVEGVVWLRGEAKNPTMVKKLERQALEVPEVKRVENLLHLPKTPAPTRTDTPAAQRRTRRTKPKQTARRVTPARVSREHHVQDPAAEPSPAEVAREHRGRPAAPLGSEGAGEQGGGAASTGEQAGGAETFGGEPSGPGSGPSGPVAIPDSGPAAGANGDEQQQSGAGPSEEQQQ